MEPKKEHREETAKAASNILKLSVKGDGSITFIPEAGFDSEIFTKKAWDNLLKERINNNPDIKVILIDGAISRLDRPEYMTTEKLLTYWQTDTEEAEKISENLPNSQQYNSMVRTQMQILEERLTELKKNCPQVRIILSLHADDLQYSFTAMMNELLIVKQEAIADKLKNMNARISRTKQSCREYKLAISSLRQKAKGKSAKGNTARKIGTLEKKLEAAGTLIEEDKTHRETIYQEQAIYRVKKARPLHQVMTRDFTEIVYNNYRELCKKLGVFFINCPTVITINDLAIDYAHSRHDTWGVIKRRPENLLKSFHGRMVEYQRQMKETVGQEVDYVVESHHGSGWRTTQRVCYQGDSLNFNDISRYDSSVEEKYLHFMILPTFEDQRRVAEFLNSKRPDRMGVSGKPMSTRNSPAVKRYINGGKTGIVTITKSASSGIVGTQWLSYERILNGKTPKACPATFVSSDEHIMHRAEDALARRGFLSLYLKHLKEPFQFRGLPTRACGYINAGDIGEANSESWRHRPNHSLSADEALTRAITVANLEDKKQMIMQIVQMGMSGSAENMDDVLSAIADYLMKYLKPGLEHSELKYVLCIVPGNHVANILDRLGMKEYAFFMQRTRALGIGTFEAGRPGENNANTDPNVRVALGGYEVSLALFIEKYGLSKDNKPIFGPIKLFLAHDPKGEGTSGLVGAVKNSGADLGIAGHTHETWVQLTGTADNSWSVAFRVATMQKVTATEIKYANTPPRTTGAHILIMPEPGDFSEFFLDINYLRRLGQEDIEKEIAAKSKK